MKTFLLLCVMALSAFGQAYHADNKTTTMHTPFRWVVADSAARVNLSVTARDTQKMCFQLADTSIWVLIDNSPKNWAWVSGKKIDSLYVSGGLKATRATITSAGIGSAAITQETVDSSTNRVVKADSATIPVLKGNVVVRGAVTADSATISILKGAKTIRDTSTFTGGTYLTRLSTPEAGITRANIDTSHTRHATSDSATIPIFIGNETHRGDSNYFAGIARFAGTLYAPVVDIDSMIGDIKIGGNIWAWGNIASPVGCYASNATEFGSYIGVFKNQGSLPGYGTRYYPVLKTDNPYIYFAANNKHVASFGNDGTNNSLRLSDNAVDQANILLQSNGPSYINGSLKVQACTTSSILSTGTITAPSFVATTGTFSGAVQAETFNSGEGPTEIPLYSSGSFTMTLYENSTNRASGTAYWQRVGSVVTLLIPGLLSTLSGSDVTLTGLPTEILPYDNQNFVKMLYSNDAIIYGTMSLFYNSNYIDVNKMDGSDLSAGNSGIPSGTSITYFAN